MSELKKTERGEDASDISEAEGLNHAFENTTSCDFLITEQENLIQLSEIVKNRTAFPLGIIVGALFQELNQWKERAEMQNKGMDLEERVVTLEKEIERLKKQRISIDSITQLWDNEYDDKWNSV